MNGLLFEMGKCYQEFRGMYGSRLCRMSGTLVLMISYDDILDEEIKAFKEDCFSVKIKTFGPAVILMFCFDGYLVDVPFDLIEDYLQLKDDDGECGRKESMIILVCESSTGEVCVLRNLSFPEEIHETWKALRKKFYEMYGDHYDSREIKRVLTEIYDNHTIDEINELVGDKELVFELS